MKSSSTNFVLFHHLLFFKFNMLDVVYTIIKPLSADVSSKFIALQMQGLFMSLLQSVFYSDISIRAVHITNLDI